MENNWNSKRFVLFPASAFMAVLLAAMLIHSAGAAPSGDKMFAASCVACHPGGKNIIDPKKPIIGSKKLANKDSFKALLSKASGSMPSFANIAKDDPAVTALYSYVKSLK